VVGASSAGTKQVTSERARFVLADFPVLYFADLSIYRTRICFLPSSFVRLYR
jgi:hypothetical protein